MSAWTDPEQIIVTMHANKRYRQRIEPCSKRDAADRLRHAVSIARPASVPQLLAARVRPSSVALWCEVECLLLVCERKGIKVAVLTVFRAPSHDEAVSKHRAWLKQKRLGDKRRRNLTKEMA